MYFTTKVKISLNSNYKKKNEKIIIWALYDDANSSYKKAIEKYFDDLNLEVHSIGINNVKFKKSDKYFYHKIDLSLNNFDLFKELNKIHKPHIILASPPCESWSGADCNGKMFRSIDAKGNWVVKNRKFYDKYNKTCNPVKKRYFIQKERSRLLGESTIGATIEIIEHFEPRIWIIENPQSSKTWDFQKYHWNFKGKENLTYYSSYDKSFSTKPTIFKSNEEFNLRKIKNKKSNKNHMAYGTYKTRSSIPYLLIKEIIEECLNVLNQNVGRKKW